MSWRDVSHEELSSFCLEWKSKQDFINEFNFTESEARHCFNYLKKLKTDFCFRECMNEKKRRSHQIKTIII